jgi:polysaccharide pyruvyl transferase WcaK-like protein
MKILITNAYTWYNKGDAAILIGMFKAIRVFIPEAEITVLSILLMVEIKNCCKSKRERNIKSVF